MICAGIDAGSRTIKVVLFDAGHGKVIASDVSDQGVAQDALASQLFDSLLNRANLAREDVRRIVATGYGRNIIDFADTTITEITCHAAGVRHVVPEAATVIDIGGQDSKVLWLTAEGTVRDFAVNDRS